MRMLSVLLVLLSVTGPSALANRPMKWESLMLMKAAAEKGDADAQFLIGLQYKAGDGVSKDVIEAAKWLGQAAGSGHIEAQAALGALRAESGDGVEAAKWLRTAAEQGNTEAMLNLGSLYSRNEAVAPDPTEALRWYLKAAEAGQAGACKALAGMYGRGQGVARDPAQALQWYRKAAALGDTEAEFILGRIDAVTRAVTEDPEKALAWWRTEAEKGDLGAGLALELIAVRTRTMDEDPAETVRWSLLLSGLRGPDAYVLRGLMLENGVAVNRDLAAAAVSYRHAAELGHALGQFRLGRMYAEGHGVTKDVAEAVKWLELASKQELTDATEVLAKLRAEPSPVPDKAP